MKNKKTNDFLCSFNGDEKCKKQCFTCSEDQKCDENISSSACPICKSKDLFDLNDHYTICNKCGFSFVG